MNKNIPLVLTVLLSSATFVYAHDTGVPHEEPQVSVTASQEARLVPIAQGGRKPVLAPGQASGSQSDGMGRRPMMGSTTQGMGMLPMPPVSVSSMAGVTTGDPVIDEQIKALNKEMEAKVKALRDEYALKVKAIIGDKKIIPRVSTTTRMNEGDRPGMMRGSSTTAPRSDDRGMRMMGSTTVRADDGHVLGASLEAESALSKDQPQGDISFIRSFFKSILGR